MDIKEPQIREALLREGLIRHDAKFIYDVHKGRTPAVIIEINNDSNHLIVKIDSPTNTQRTTSFLYTYSGIDKFPKILYIDNHFTFYAYTFIVGTSFTDISSNISEVGSIVTNVINNYSHANEIFYGTREHPNKTLKDSLLGDVIWRIIAYDAKNLIGLKELHKIEKSIHTVTSKWKGLPYVVHGDLSVDNILGKDGKLAGIIDPFVTQSLPIIELLALVTASPPRIGHKQILLLSKMLKDSSGFSDSEIIELYKVQLFLQGTIAAKFHPEDFEIYLEAYKKC